MLLGGRSSTEVLYVLVWVIVALRGYVGSMAMAMLGNAEWEGPGSGEDNTSIASGSGNLQNNVSCYSTIPNIYNIITTLKCEYILVTILFFVRIYCSQMPIHIHMLVHTVFAATLKRKRVSNVSNFASTFSSKQERTWHHISWQPLF